MHDLATEIQRQGHSVILMTPSSSIAGRFQVSAESSLTVVRVRTRELKSASRVWRAINEALLSFTMWRNARMFLETNPCDLIVWYSPTIFFGSLVRRLKKLWGCPAYLVL